jgi:hypothetical protein
MKRDLDELTRQLIEEARAPGGMTEKQMVARAEQALDDQVDTFEREALATIEAMQGAALVDVLSGAETLRAASLLYRYDLLGVLAASLVLWCSEHAEDPRLQRAIRAHADAMRTVVSARMRGERAAAHDALLDGLERTLRAG